MTENKKSPKDKWILIYFIAFFGVIFVVNAFFLYTATTTQTGLITKDAYKKGLHYNETLAQAKSQPALKDTLSFKGKTLRWTLIDSEGKKIKTAKVTAHIIRPIQDGHDFDITLSNKGNGIYEAILTLPFNGLWMAKLESQWNNQTYKTTHQFIKK